MLPFYLLIKCDLIEIGPLNWLVQDYRDVSICSKICFKKNCYINIFYSSFDNNSILYRHT